MRLWRKIPISCALLAGLSLGHFAMAGVITVGSAGTNGNCTKPTLQSAIDYARNLGGYNVIYVTRDVAGAVWHENITMENLPPTLSIDIVGGFDDCDAGAPNGHTIVSSTLGSTRPVFKISGAGTVGLYALDIINGNGGTLHHAGGIDYRGRGSLVLGDTSVRGNGLSVHELDTAGGIHFEGSGGQAHLGFLDDVFVMDNSWNGVVVRGTATFVVEAARARFWRNSGSGLVVRAPATASIGSSGAVFSGNSRFGMHVDTSAMSTATLRTHIYSTDAANVLQFSANRRGALLVTNAEGSPRHNLCTRNIRIGEHILSGEWQDFAGSAVRVDGPGARLEMNTVGGDCFFPSPAAIVCLSEHCNTIASNTASAGSPLVSVTNGGAAVIDHAHIANNTAASIFSTNFGTGLSNAILLVATSLVAENTVSDHLVEAGDGSFLLVSELTFAANAGTFQHSLASHSPTLLSMASSIVDQNEPLVAPGSTSENTALDRVLTRNAVGAHDDDVILIDRPEFVPFSYRLSAGSPGVDYAVAVGGSDLDGNPRDVDTLGIVNIEGPRDLGAFESQVPAYVSDRIFVGSFD